MKKLLCAAAVLFMSVSLRAEERVTIDKVAGKTGEFHVQLTERSPLSSLAEMAKRMSGKPDPSVADYDLSAQDFYVYVPSAPGDDGKYGLLDVMPFIAGHGFTPAAQKPILEKYHLIWIAPMNGGDDQPSQQRMGEFIDAVYNARKAWPISDRRVYAMVNSWHEPETGVGLYYADQFTGLLQTKQLRWYTPTRTKEGVYQAQLSHPREEMIAQAKKLRFFAAITDGLEPKMKSLDDAIFRDGYQHLMKYTKRVVVPDKGINIWSDFTADWFEKGIQFLDEGPMVAAEMPASKPASRASVATTRPIAATTRPSVAATRPSAEPASDEDQASRVLSLAESYVSAKRYDVARTKLQKLVSDFPDTKSAADAKKILVRIKDK